jgi:hypothetical protein
MTQQRFRSNKKIASPDEDQEAAHRLKVDVDAIEPDAERRLVYVPRSI